MRTGLGDHRLIFGIGGYILAMLIAAGAGCSDGSDPSGNGGAAATSSSSGSGGAGGAGLCDAAAHPIAVSSTTHDVPPCGSYFTPLNNGTSTVTVFSEQQDPFTIRNSSSAPVTINAITIEEQGDVQDEEFTLQNADLKNFEFTETTIEAGGVYDFYLRFFPVASDDRKAKVTITYDSDKVYDFTITGKGTPGAKFLADPAQVKTWLLGSSNTTTDEQTGGLTADAAGNIYITANEEESSDNLIVARVNADGTLGWAKRFDGPYNIKAPDAGQNSETGGTSGSVALGADGKLYVIAAASWTPSNTSFYTLVAKIEPSDGSLLWSKLWSSVPSIINASQSSTAYAIDASDASRLFITGGTQGESEVLALALSTADGSALFQRRIDVAPGLNDRGYAVRYAGDGILYIGGQRSGNAGLLIKLTGANGANPAVAWTKSVGLGTGGNINSIDADANGNTFAALDIRGAATIFGVGSFDATGKARWLRAYSGNTGDNNNVHVVRLIDGTLYAAGRTGPPNFDGQLGDGALVRIHPDDGADLGSGFYFNGKGPDELAEHRVKGVAIAGKTLLLGMQVYTGTMNGVRYWGYWYDGVGAVEAFGSEPAVSNETGVMATINAGTVQSVGDKIPNVYWEDLPTSIVFQRAQDKTGGTPPDGDIMILTMPLP